MNENDIKNKIKEIHESSFKGVIENYNIRRLFVSFPFLFSLILTGLLFVFNLINADSFEFDLRGLLELSITIIPSLLGFSLGGFAIIVSFNDKFFLKKLNKIEIDYENKKLNPSLFQSLIAVFAWGIIMQAVTLVISFLLKYLDLIFPNYSAINPCVLNHSFLSNFFFLVLSFFMTYSLMLIPYIVKNVYGFGQLVHFISLKDKN